MINKCLKRYVPVIAGTVLAGLLAAPLSATTITSSAYGLYVNLKVANLVGVGIAPVGAIAGAAFPAYMDSTEVASVNQTLALGTKVNVLPALSVSIAEGVKTGIIDTTAASPYPVTPTGNASATLNHLSLNLNSSVGGLSTTLLGLGSTLVKSTAAVSGTNGLTAVGSTKLAGLTLTGLVLGTLTIDGSLFSNPDPNTVLLNLLGIKIVLNEQIKTGDFLSAAGITTNSIHISFKNYLLATGLLNGDIIVSNSVATIMQPSAPDGVPEPGVWLELIVGFAAVGVMARRRSALA